MGFFKKQHQEVIEMYESGHRALTISALTGIPLDEVYEVLEEYHAEYREELTDQYEN